MAGHRLIPVCDCPSCHREPTFVHHWFRGYRMECKPCSTFGPYVRWNTRGGPVETENDARTAWNNVMSGRGGRMPRRPPPPVGSRVQP